MSSPFFLVDAFAEHAFAGNPAGVCFPRSDVDSTWMQSVATKINQAETAFLQPRNDGTWDLRWFTPTVEVDLCGHATLVSSHVLWTSERVVGDEPIRFHTRSGVLTCQRRGSSIEMDFPAEPATVIENLYDFAFVFDLVPVHVARNRMDLVIVLESADAVRQLVPDFQRIRQIDARGVIVTARSDRTGIDFISRFFAPQSGVPEDPVTGSAHCCLGPYWRDQLKKDELVGYQASKRGGMVHVHCRGERVVLGGKAVTVVSGDLQV